MNYNYGYGPPQSPHDGGNHQRQTSGYAQNGGQNYGYPQQAGGGQMPQMPQMTPMYGQPQYTSQNAWQNGYGQSSPQQMNASLPQQSWPTYSSQPQVVIPQRTPMQTPSPAMGAPPTFQPQTQYYSQQSYSSQPQTVQQTSAWQNNSSTFQQPQQYTNYGQQYNTHAASNNFRPPPQPSPQPRPQQSPQVRPQPSPNAQSLPLPQARPQAEPQSQSLKSAAPTTARPVVEIPIQRPPQVQRPPSQPLQQLQRPPSQPQVQPHRPLPQNLPYQSPKLPQQPRAQPQANMGPQPQRPSNKLTPRNTASASPALNHVTSVRRESAPASPAGPPVDYQQLLLLMAEDYIEAAHGMGSLVAFYRRQEDLKQYFGLMATGLSCIEASLTLFRLAPQAEARLVLQYCNLMYKETENYDEVDKWLSKTIPLCDRNKLLDIKYSMQHLSARALFKTKPKVAIKTLDGLIPNVQAYGHTPWVYAMRLLRVSFTFQAGITNQDLASAIQNLKSISQLAAEDDDGAISLISATYEALLHLRSMSSSCVEDAQRAIAAAKSLQFHPLAQSLKQIWTFLECIEVICYLMEGNAAKAAQKAEALAPVMDQMRASPRKNDDGMLFVPLAGSPRALTESTCGIFQRQEGRDHLVFRWITERDLWTFCYLLNAIAAQTRAAVEAKAEAYVQQGLKIMKENLSDSTLHTEQRLPKSSSLSSTVERLDWWYNLRWFFQIYMVINACSRSEWSSAQDQLSHAIECPHVSSINGVESRNKWQTLLQAAIFQGQGQTEAALRLYNAGILSLPSTHRTHDVEADLAVLAVLNQVLITIDPSHPQHLLAISQHANVTPMLEAHPNKSLRAAHDLLRAVLNPSDKVTDSKRHLQNCLKAARDINNAQLVSISLSLMCTMFFKDQVGEQAKSAVKSARTLANRSKSKLWSAVTAGLQEGTAMVHGDVATADMAKADLQRLVETLPEGIKQELEVDEEMGNAS